jgi:OOP family OmpA-OmpF porin
MITNNERRSKMKQKNQSDKSMGTVPGKLLLLLMVLGLVLPGMMATQSAALEIITEEDILQETVTKEDFIKLADNFIILVDTSESMAAKWKKGAEKSKLEIAKEILTSREQALPDLGFNAGLYSFSPFKALYPMAPLDKAKYAQAIAGLPATASGNTFLPRALRDLDPVLQGLSGKTVVFIFNDGGYSQLGAGTKDAGDLTAEMAKKYDVCFYIIGDNRQNLAIKRLKDVARANECSRWIKFAQFIENPQYHTGALYLVKTSSEVVTLSDQRVVGAKGVNIHFDFDSTVIRPEYHAELDKIGEFLQKDPNSYVVFAGFTDNTGDEEYNLSLSRRRAESAGAYLQKTHNIDADRIVADWFGKHNPVADNGTAEGRQLNRRVESAIGFK